MYVCLQAEDGIRYWSVTGVQTCALPISQFPCRHDNPIGERIRSATLLHSLANWVIVPTRELGRGKKSPSMGGRPDGAAYPNPRRSEERRVGKEGKARGWRDR